MVVSCNVGFAAHAFLRVAPKRRQVHSPSVKPADVFLVAAPKKAANHCLQQTSWEIEHEMGFFHVTQHMVTSSSLDILVLLA